MSAPLDARLYGVGLGPGDPDYMTLRALKVLQRADRLAHFCKRGKRGNARTIADAVVAPDPAREIALAYPVTTEIPADHPDYAAALGPFYAESAARIATEVEAGRTVAVLCEGDPFFYGSFMHLWRRLAARFAIEVVPGVTGMSGCWTRAKTPMTWGDDMLAVLPGTLGEPQLVERLRLTDAAVIMKVGRNLAKVRRAVEAAGLLSRAIYVERGTMQDERIVPLAECRASEGAYFAMVLIPGQGRQI